MKMKSMMIYHHLGLGDHIICNGLVRFLLQKYNPSRIFLPTKIHNYNTVARMYLDKIEIVPIVVNTDSDVANLPHLSLCEKIIQVGFSNVRDDWDVSFYDTTGISFSVRWDMFSLVRDKNREDALRKKLSIKDEEKYILIHNRGSDKEYDLSIFTNIRKIYVEPITNCMFDWCSLAENAEEVHCIDSSFVHLTQSLNIKRGIFHNIRSMNTSFSLKKSWQTVDYTKRKTS